MAPLVSFQLAFLMSRDLLRAKERVLLLSELPHSSAELSWLPQLNGALPARQAEQTALQGRPGGGGGVFNCARRFSFEP
jgi:hypothetical protein